MPQQVRLWTLERHSNCLCGGSVYVYFSSELGNRSDIASLVLNEAYGLAMYEDENFNLEFNDGDTLNSSDFITNSIFDKFASEACRN